LELKKTLLYTERTFCFEVFKNLARYRSKDFLILSSIISFDL